MYLLEFKFNEQKIESDGEYELAEFYRVIRIMFARHNLPEMEKDDGSLWFKDNGGERDLGALFAVVFALAEEEWFAKYIERLWYYDTDDEDENTDLIKMFKRDKRGAFADYC